MRLWKSFFCTYDIFNNGFFGHIRNDCRSKNAPPQKPLTIKELPEFGVTKGEILYSRYCSFCHGESGAGGGLNAFSIPVKPRSFNDQDVMAQKTDIELEKVILFGGASQRLSKYMPPFGKILSDLEAKNLIKHIRKDFLGNLNSK